MSISTYRCHLGSVNILLILSPFVSGTHCPLLFFWLGVLALSTRCWMEMGTFVFCLLSWTKISLSPMLSAMSASSCHSTLHTIITLILTGDTEPLSSSLSMFCHSFVKNSVEGLIFVRNLDEKVPTQFYNVSFLFMKACLFIHFTLKMSSTHSSCLSINVVYKGGFAN